MFGEDGGEHPMAAQPKSITAATAGLDLLVFPSPVQSR
jgi:hypothetical protein